MNILVIGSGGREHAMAWKLAQSERVAKVFVAPGNAGTAQEPNLVNVPVTSIPDLIDLVRREHIALTVVGPEAPLSQGVVDAFRAEGLKIFGPTKAAARLEWSKDFAKDFMIRHGIPTAQYKTFSVAAEAHTYIDLKGAPIVIKADGLAAGKGVIVAMTVAEAHAAIDTMLIDNKMGDAGARVVIEDFLVGEEASFIVMVDGRNVLAFASSQDHKRLRDNDEGPNTGGMGAYSPAPVVTPAVHARAMREVILPTVAGMARDGVSYTGFLYAGLMVGEDGSVNVVEFNCRMGDPETQPIMMRLKSDLVELVEHGVNGTLDQVDAEWDRRVALGVVMAAEGYPESPRKGDLVTGPAGVPEDAHVFHAGTVLDDKGRALTAGGRVLCVTALGDSVRIAQKRAYDVVEQIHFEGKQYRQDIGFRAIARKSVTA
ncbi:phosphoribosylamine--glycine ligase [Parachitinimonas caeni]|uniref:Phosphoribosylamine--glycine ligase n=1 Tax=Parachitinimonas caeni TaxID=3031301 RepID=A0ABT7DY27_9NEIS|nr:phosphoribosylamine--glycine ligase [Parachitinimonas caeni]MDK2124968.1 phosphoribosylamine--glycine ligase [Parachitinimonas caeni]